MPNTLPEENIAGCDFIDVRPRAVIDRSSSGLELSFHLRADRIKENTLEKAN